MKSLTKFGRFIPVIASLIIIVLLGVAFGIGFIKIIIPADGSYRELVFNSFFDLEEGIELYTFSMDACSTILTFVGTGIALVSLIVNLFLSLINRNKLLIFLILSILTILGLATVIVHYSLLLSNLSYTFSRSFSSGDTIMTFGIILSSLATLVTIAEIALCMWGRETIFRVADEDKDNKILYGFASAGVLFVAIAVVFASGAIPFSSTKTSSWTETADWGDIVGGYKGNVGDKIEHVTKTTVSGCAYENIPCILLMVAFAIMVIVFFIIAVKKDDDEYMKTLIISSAILGVISNIVEFFMCGGTAWLFGIGTFMVLGAIIALGAFKILENSKLHVDLKNIN